MVAGPTVDGAALVSICSVDVGSASPCVGGTTDEGADCVFVLSVTYLNDKVLFRLYLAFHQSNLTETKYVEHNTHALQSTQVWLKLATNEGQFT